MSQETVDAVPKKNKKPKKKGSSRSIETLFRSAYRTQLALTSIADTKANIMISVNGFIITGIIATTGLFNQILVTGYNEITGVVTYEYSLLDNEAHTQPDNDNSLGLE